MFSTSSVVLLVLGAAIAYAACPAGWEEHANSCYMFQTDKEHWISARVVCRMFGSDLVAIESQAEQDYIVEKAKTNYNHTRLGGFWLGAQDFEVNNQFSWVATGASFTGAFTAWYPGQPNNRNNTESCLAMVKDFSYQWSDDPCTLFTLNYVCEKKPTAGSDPLVG